MKSYKERTNAVLNKIDEYQNTGESVADNGNGTLSVKRGKTIATRLIAVIACIALIVTLNLLLFLPFPSGMQDVSAYEDSEYYGLITVMNKLTRKKHVYKNNFEKLMSSFSGCASKGTDTAPESLPPNGNYVETTNNQVENIIEGDLLKRSENYAFYLTHSNENLTLNVYLTRGGSVTLYQAYVIAEKGARFNYGNCEMYLSADGNAVTVLSPCSDGNGRSYVCVIKLDVSNVGDIKEISRKYVSGRYISSRLTQNSLLLFTNFSVRTRPDFSDEAQYLPQTGTLGNMHSLPVENIIFDEDARTAGYTVACAINAETLEINSSYAFLSFSDSVYVSENNIFLTRETIGEKDENYESFTEIDCLYYADGGLKYSGEARLPGTVLDQYSMDEYGGMLRVVTEVVINNGDDGYHGASLYGVKLESFEVFPLCERFAPNNESVYSVRFDAQTAYVCTALARENYLTDPVFAIDLSDPENVTVKDTGTITGYSLSLTKFKDGALLGIGYGEFTNKLKIEIYRETQNGVKSVASFTRICAFSDKFKAYFIDAENGLIGLSVSNENAPPEYLLLKSDGNDLTLANSVEIERGVYHDYTRAFFSDGYVYIFTEIGTKVLNYNA